MMGYLCAAGSAVLYGLLPFLSVVFYGGGGSPLLLVALRFLLSSLFFLILSQVRKNSLRVGKGKIFQIFVLAQGYMLTNLLLSLSYEYIPTGMATAIHFIYPILVLLVCTVLFKERLTGTGILCALLGVAGVACFYTPQGTASVPGMIMALGSAFAYAFYVIFDDKAGLSEMPPLSFGFYLSVFCGLEGILAASLSGEMSVNLSISAWLSVTAVAAGPTVLSVLLVQLGLARIGAGKVSFLSTFEPLTSAVLGIFLLDESVTLFTGLGIACILLSAVLLAAGKECK